MADNVQHFLLVIGDREALAWILTAQQMAFAPSRYRTADSLMLGDRLALYTTRGCFKNPARDRGRIIGTASVAERVHDLESGKAFQGREFNRGCALLIDRLVPFRQGPELVHIVSRLNSFPEAWGMHVRRTLVPLDHHDFEVIEGALKVMNTNFDENLHEYVEIGVPSSRTAAAPTTTRA
jgi:hypothetical protein